MFNINSSLIDMLLCVVEKFKEISEIKSKIEYERKVKKILNKLI